MKLIMLYVTLIGGSIQGMEVYNKIKSLKNNSAQLALYLESQDQYLKTPLMRLLDKGTDEMIIEVLPLLKKCQFNLEILGHQGETAFFYACDRPGIIAAQSLLALGCKINPISPSGSPIFLAFINDNLALLNLFIEEGNKPQIPSDIIAIAILKPGYHALTAAINCQRIL